MALLQFLAMDIQIYLLSFLTPPDIISMRKTCSQIYAISKLQIVWMNTCDIHIIRKGFPFTKTPLQSMTVSELEQHACRAYYLASRWRSGISKPRRTLSIDATCGTAVIDIRFLPGHSGRFVLAVSKTVWDVLSVWDISRDGRKACEWSPRGAILNGIALNTDTTSEATIAISVSQYGQFNVQLLSLQIDVDGACSLHTVNTIQSKSKPVYLDGDIIGLCDDVARTDMRNWRTGASAVLQGHRDEGSLFELNRVLQMTRAHHSILVVRDRSLTLFPEPELQEKPNRYGPLARHSFNWIDSVSATLTRFGSPPSLSVLFRGRKTNYWGSSTSHTLSFYSLQPNPDHDSAKDTSFNAGHNIPYRFPPTLVEHLPSFQGSLHCHNTVLGPCNTAAWIQPRNRAVAGLTWSGGQDEDFYLEDIDSASGHESLVLAAFPGPLLQSQNSVTMQSNVLCSNRSNNWQSLDYDEENGRIALCSSFGSLLIIEI